MAVASEQMALVDHQGHHHGEVVTTRVVVLPLSAVGDDVARDEGEGFTGAEEWRRAHVAFWRDVLDDVRTSAGDAGWELGEDEPVGVEWFRLVQKG